MYKGDFGDFFQIMSKNNWERWFEINVNHGSDGWKSFDDWFYDMERNGLLTEI